MSLRDLTPWRKRQEQMPSNFLSPFGSFQEEMNQFLNDFGPRFFSPTSEESGAPFHLARVDVVETDDAIEVSADMPGMSEDDISITLNDNVLTLKGEREHEEEDKKKDYHRIERSFGTYLRRVALPAEVEEDDVKAEFSKGVLKITLPKSTEAKSRTRKIPIRAN